jgi:hypothetical protein
MKKAEFLGFLLFIITAAAVGLRAESLQSEPSYSSYTASQVAGSITPAAYPTKLPQSTPEAVLTDAVPDNAPSAAGEITNENTTESTKQQAKAMDTPKAEATLAPSHEPEAADTSGGGSDREELKISFRSEAGDEEEAESSGTGADKKIEIGYLMAERAGLISDSFESDGVIYSLEGKELLTAGDNVFIKLNSDKGVKNGTEYVIYDDSQDVIRPGCVEDTGYMGNRIWVFGVVRALSPADKENNVWKARIIKSYDAAGNNYKLKLRKTMKDNYYKLLKTAKKKNGAVSGEIVSVSSGNASINNRDVVFIDKGTNDGLKPGDIMTVVRASDNDETGMQGKEYNEIGRIVIINAQENSAAGMVNGQTGFIRLGDIARIKAE